MILNVTLNPWLSFTMLVDQRPGMFQCRGFLEKGRFDKKLIQNT